MHLRIARRALALAPEFVCPSCTARRDFYNLTARVTTYRRTIVTSPILASPFLDTALAGELAKQLDAQDASERLSSAKYSRSRKKAKASASDEAKTEDEDSKADEGNEIDEAKITGPADSVKETHLPKKEKQRRKLPRRREGKAAQAALKPGSTKPENAKQGDRLRRKAKASATNATKTKNPKSPLNRQVERGLVRKVESERKDQSQLKAGLTDANEAISLALEEVRKIRELFASKVSKNKSSKAKTVAISRSTKLISKPISYSVAPSPVTIKTSPAAKIRKTAVKVQKTAAKPKKKADDAPEVPDVPIETIDSSKLEMLPVEVDQPPIPTLAYGLERVLFNPGVYQLQDPRSRVYNFDPYLQKIMPIADFDFNALKEYITSSRDKTLETLAKEKGKRYVGSTSSMTSVLSHYHFLLSQWREVNTSMVSTSFPADLKSFTALSRGPAAIFLKWQDGTYAIDADKEFATSNVLSMLGKSMEKMLTLETTDFERYRKTNPEQVSEEERTAPEAYHYSTQGDFLMRSQLDAYDPRLPGTGMFDLKTRAVVSIRMNVDDYEILKGYEIMDRYGDFESYEREYYDMIRSAFLKYSLQVRMGRMDGIFVAFHNTQRIFGFQYISINEMDFAIHGQYDTQLGDQEFKISLDLMNKVMNKATEKFPEQNIRLHFETRDTKIPFMYIFAEPVTDKKMCELQSANDAKIIAFEREALGLTKDAADETSDAEWDGIRAKVDETIEEEEANEDELAEDIRIPSEETEMNESVETGSLETESLEDTDAGKDDLSGSAHENIRTKADGSHLSQEISGQEVLDDSGTASVEVPTAMNEFTEVQSTHLPVELLLEEGTSDNESSEFTLEPSVSELSTSLTSNHEDPSTSSGLANSDGLSMMNALTQMELHEMSIDCTIEGNPLSETQLNELFDNNAEEISTSLTDSDEGSDAMPGILSGDESSYAFEDMGANSAQSIEEALAGGGKDSSADREFLDELETEYLKTEGRPLLAMTLTIRSKVGNKIVTRPDKIDDKNTWQVEYAMAEITDRARAWRLYQMCQARREKILNGKDTEDRYKQPYLAMLRKLSEKREKYRKEQDQKEQEKEEEPIVFGMSKASESKE